MRRPPGRVPSLPAALVRTPLTFSAVAMRATLTTTQHVVTPATATTIRGPGMKSKLYGFPEFAADALVFVCALSVFVISTWLGLSFGGY